jgi:dTDP-4-amino-4,6-dideoxygalactose transaminase
VQAAIGREQLKRVDTIIGTRRTIADRYRMLLETVHGLAVPIEPSWARSNWQSFSLVLPNRCDQLQVMQAMLESGIATKRGIMCAHREPAYPRESWLCGVRSCNDEPGPCAHLGNSEWEQDRSIIIPLYCDMTEQEILSVVNVLRAACEKVAESKDITVQKTSLSPAPAGS